MPESSPVQEMIAGGTSSSSVIIAMTSSSLQ